MINEETDVSPATTPTPATDQAVYDAFMACGALRWPWWLDEEIEGDEADGWLFTGVLWGGDPADDWAMWDDYTDHERYQSFEFKVGPDEIRAALEWIAGLDQDLARRQAGVGPGLLFEARKWVAGEWADCDFDADTADQVLQVAVQLASTNPASHTTVLYA